MSMSPEEFIAGMEARGVPRVAAIALAGNGRVESGLDPQINEINPVVPGSRGGFGLMQWTGPRRRQLEAFAASKGEKPGDPNVQMDFLAWELQNTEKRAAEAIFAASNVPDAARIVSEQFLRPGIPHLDRRIAEAEALSEGAETRTDATSEKTKPARNFSALHEAYENGNMTDRERATYEAGVQAGLIPKRTEQPAPTARVAPAALAAAYRAGQLPQKQMDIVQKAIDGGLMKMPSEPDTRVPLIPLEGEGSTARAVPDLSNELSQPGLDLASRALSGITGSGPDVVDIPDSVPLGVGDIDVPIPAPLQRFGEEVSNFVMGGAGLASAAFGGGVGSLADLAVSAGADPEKTERLAGDLMAVPEAFAGSPSAIVRAGRVPKVPKAGRTTSKAVEIASTPSDIGELVRTAAGNGPGARQAREKLAQSAKFNREAFEAAERLGIELPADVFSDNQMIREAAGLTRSVAGSEASAAWRESIAAAADKADEAMRSLGGSPDIASVSDNVLSTLRETQAKLRSQADSLYAKVDGAIAKNTTIEPNNIVRTLNDVIQELGGVEGMTAQERQLFNLVTSDQPVTYARLMREKNAIGKALRGKESPYGSVDEATLKRLYSALAEDQLANVERVGGADLRGNLELANKLVAQRKNLEDSIVNAFGKDGEGSIASKLRLSITRAGKGDVANLNRVLNLIPKDLRREAVATALISATRSARATEPGFGFAEFAKTYAGLRENGPVYSRIVKELGEDGHELLEGLAQVSKRVTDARANVLSTGKANLALVQGMTAESIVGKVMNSSAGQRAQQGAAGLGGAMAMGPVGAALAPALTTSLTAISRDRIGLAGKLFRDPAFQKMITEVGATGRASASAVRAVQSSEAFNKWAGTVGLTNPAGWLSEAISTTQQEQDQ